MPLSVFCGPVITMVDDAIVGDDLEPDDDMMHRFLPWWFERSNKGHIEIAWTNAATGTLNLFRRFGIDEVSQAALHAATVNAIPGCNVYFRPATVDASTVFTKDGDVIQIPGCWVDCDEAEAVERVLQGPGPAPSAQVITGRVPGLRSQFLFKFSEPSLAGDRARALNRQAAAACGSDTMVINPSTLLRLPGSIAWPKKPGRVPELTEWITPDRHQDSWTPNALRLGFPPVADEEAVGSGTHTASAGGTTELLNPIKGLIEQVRAGPLWHEPTLRLVAMLVTRGRQDCEILAMAEHLTWPDYSVAQTRDELIKMIEGARRKGFAPDDSADQADEPAPDGVDDVMDVKPAAAATFPVLTRAKLADVTPPEWLIRDLVITDGLCCLYGQFRSYKSFIALDWALCLATGTDWCGHKVKQSDVLYIAGEGVGGLQQRVATWEQHHGVTGSMPGFRIIPLAVNLMDKAEAERLILTVIEEQKADGFSPRLIIVDTLHRSMPGGDENSAKDMGIVIGNAALIQRRLGCAMLPVHHCGKDADRGLRGSSGLPGAADTIIRVSRTDSRVTLLIEKQKDVEDGQEINLQAQVVDLPLIAGSLKPRSSLVLVPDEQGADRPDQNLTKTERAAKRFLADLIVAEGKPLPYGGGFPSPVARPAPPRSGDLPLAGGMRDPSPVRRRATKNRSLAFRRAFQGLLDKRMVAARADLIWLAS